MSGSVGVSLLRSSSSVGSGTVSGVVSPGWWSAYTAGSCTICSLLAWVSRALSVIGAMASIVLYSGTLALMMYTVAGGAPGAGPHCEREECCYY